MITGDSVCAYTTLKGFSDRCSGRRFFLSRYRFASTIGFLKTHIKEYLFPSQHLKNKYEQIISQKNSFVNKKNKYFSYFIYISARFIKIWLSMPFFHAKARSCGTNNPILALLTPLQLPQPHKVRSWGAALPQRSCARALKRNIVHKPR